MAEIIIRSGALVQAASCKYAAGSLQGVQIGGFPVTLDLVVIVIDALFLLLDFVKQGRVLGGSGVSRGKVELAKSGSGALVGVS